MLNNAEILSASMIDLTNGKTFELGDVTSISIESEDTDTYMDAPIQKISGNQDASLLGDCEFDTNVFWRAVNIKTPIATIFYGRLYLGMIPRRRHKAKRIAKKVDKKIWNDANIWRRESLRCLPGR